MAVREDYSNFKWFEMFEAEDYGEGLISGELSSLSVDTRGYEAVTLMINIGSLTVVSIQSCMAIALMHADSVTAASYDYVSSTDLIGSDYTPYSGGEISFGGSVALTSGKIMKMAMGAASVASGEGTWAVGYVGKRRYLKAMLVSEGSVNTGSMYMCMMAVATRPANWPIADPNP